MAEDWSQQEVEATVQDYFGMLHAELRGEPYGKTQHRRHLASMLTARSDGAIERKHQNISAILIELGFPYIQGYKPLRNYQQLLFDVTAARLATSQPLVEVVEAQVQQPAAVPTVDDILASLIDAPVHDPAARNYSDRIRERPGVPPRVDYLQLESRNRSLGAAGEEFVVRFEVARLLRARLDRLANRVERVSHTRGDGIGFDVLSFEESGLERLVEVKTTAYGRETPFFVTRNELEVSQKEADQYFLYRVFDFRRTPGLFHKRGHLERSFTLDPVQYLASV
jgi:Domain of unknown function (DUF3883)